VRAICGYAFVAETGRGEVEGVVGSRDLPYVAKGEECHHCGSYEKKQRLPALYDHNKSR